MPKLGDKKKRGICSYCGATMYDIWKSWPVYHNDTEEGWEPDSHLYTDYRGITTWGPCIRNLLKKIKKLESK